MNLFGMLKKEMESLRKNRELEFKLALCRIAISELMERDYIDVSELVGGDNE